MMSDLFSSLDCMSTKFSTLVWITPILMAASFTVSNSWGQTYIKSLSLMISTNSVTSQKGLLGFPLMLFSLMTFLLSMNFLGLVPFMYGPTSNIWVSAGLALMFWTTLIISGWMKYPIESMAHLVPNGAPAALAPFLVLIETSSLLIRPLTLSIRIIANISTGHIIMGLVACALTSLITTFTLSGPVMLFCHVVYNLFEVFVCTVQAYVFSLLVKLYGEEHP